MPDGPFYIDGKPPFSVNNSTTTSLTTVNQNILPSSWLPLLGGYFNFVGKLLYMRCTGVCTSVATPGNFGINFFWGNNTANNGTNIANVGYTWTANVAGAAFQWELWVRCRALGTSGSLFSWGNIFISSTGIINFPFSSPAAVTVDLTANNYISPQVNRSGSTAETITPYEVTTIAMN